MLGKLLMLIVIVGAGYWYWSGPYQERVNPGFEKRLEINARNMRDCLRGQSYKPGATGEVGGDPEQVCARRYNLYKLDGQWHSYDDSRPD